MNRGTSVQGLIRTSAVNRRIVAGGWRIVAEDSRMSAESRRIVAGGWRIVAEGRQIFAEDSRMSAVNWRIVAEGCRTSPLSQPKVRRYS